MVTSPDTQRYTHRINCSTWTTKVVCKVLRTSITTAGEPFACCTACVGILYPVLDRVGSWHRAADYCHERKKKSTASAAAQQWCGNVDHFSQLTYDKINATFVYAFWTKPPRLFVRGESGMKILYRDCARLAKSCKRWLFFAATFEGICSRNCVPGPGSKNNYPVLNAGNQYPVFSCDRRKNCQRFVVICTCSSVSDSTYIALLNLQSRSVSGLNILFCGQLISTNARYTQPILALFTFHRIFVFSERELTFTFAICYRQSVCLSVVCL